MQAAAEESFREMMKNSSGFKLLIFSRVSILFFEYRSKGSSLYRTDRCWNSY